jgi:hypothetical protein
MRTRKHRARRRTRRGGAKDLIDLTMDSPEVVDLLSSTSSASHSRPPSPRQPSPRPSPRPPSPRPSPRPHSPRQPSPRPHSPRQPSPRQPSPRQPSPRQPSPRPPSPRQPSPRQPSPRPPSPRPPSPRQPSPRQPSPRQPSPRPPSPRQPSPRQPSPRPPSPRPPLFQSDTDESDESDDETFASTADIVGPCRYMHKQLSAAEIKERRGRVTQGYRHSHSLDGFDVTQLRELFDLYDRHFFDNAFNRYLVPPNKFEVKFTTHATTTAGFCSRTGCDYYISINKSIFTDRLFTGAAQHFHAANGLVCRTKLDCLQLVMEHEMIHLVQFIWHHQCGNSKQRAHGREFKRLAKNIFGHTETKHELFRELTAEQAEGYTYRKQTRYDDAKKRVRDDLHVGDIIEVDNMPGQFRVEKVPVNKREVNIKVVKLSDNSKWRLKVSIGYKIVGRADPASSTVPSSKERMVEAMNRNGKVTVSVRYKGDVHKVDVVKMNPTKFLIKIGVNTIGVPYDYHDYRIV